MVSNTGLRSPGELEMTRSTSEVAVCCSSDSLNSWVRCSDLLFQAGIGFLQLARHVVELVGERLEFVPGLDRDALREIAAADARRAGLQRLDRSDHAAGEKHPGEHGETERAQKHEGEPLQCRVERRVGFLGRQLRRTSASRAALRGHRR